MATSRPGTALVRFGRAPPRGAAGASGQVPTLVVRMLGVFLVRFGDGTAAGGGTAAGAGAAGGGCVGAA